VAFIPAVPGLAPGASMGAREGLPVTIEPASQASAGEDRNPVGQGVCGQSCGLMCGIKAPSASWGTVTERTMRHSQAYAR
jgi:hypothetical protein